ncbi:hypothetical protein CDL15_Pgr027386 [Punica granatum]|uniref:Uncharacterized protein n=1 Tax=Punica granatum TaxID=22663 RepID=A0A218Y229_PUNGR|nr:hypothetical protein CDL15_Pgr027386 [Punica granatum]PKI40853.1 hypothetical protein CRG98_038760 [Punica granatum]
MVVGLRSQILLRIGTEQIGSNCCGAGKRWNELETVGLGVGVPIYPPSSSAVGEISEEPSPRRVNSGSDDRFRDFMLKRSYSFGFKRSIALERMPVMEPAMTSPWRYHTCGAGDSGHRDTVSY